MKTYILCSSIYVHISRYFKFISCVIVIIIKTSFILLYNASLSVLNHWVATYLAQSTGLEQ